MDVAIVTMPALRVGALTHRGPYPTIGQTFERLGGLADKIDWNGKQAPNMIAIFLDDPETTPAEELRSEAGLLVDEATQLPSELHEVQIPAGTYARTTHVGSYASLGETWARLKGDWLPKSALRGRGMSYELYRVMDMSTPQKLETDLYLELEVEPS